MKNAENLARAHTHTLLLLNQEIKKYKKRIQ